MLHYGIIEARKEEMTKTKLYKFNMQKYGHNIELAYNHQRNKVDSENATDEDWKAFENVQDVYMKLLSTNNGYYALVPYEVWQKATEISMWSENHRNQMNAISRI